MATISEITQGASYRGEAALGGSLGVTAILDPTPLARLATFTYYRDRDMWEKKNADDKLAADKIAAITGFDITSPLKPFSEDLKNELASIQSYVRDNPDALVYGRNPQKFQELSNKINQFANKRKGATANDVLYNAQKSAIEKISDPQTKELRRRELDVKVDRLFGEGLERAYNTQIDALPDLKPSDYEIPTAAITSRSFIDVDPNSNTEITVEYVDMDDLISKSELTAASPAETVNVEGLSPEEQQIEREKANLSGSKRRGLQKIASEFNPLLEQWQAANPNIDISTVDPKDLPSGTISDIVRSIKSVNNQIDELNGYVARGKVVDKGGFVKQNPYGKINIADGLTEAEVVMMKTIQENGNSLIKKVDKQVQFTGEELRRQGQLLDYRVGWANANKKPAGSGGKMEEAIENPARIFGTHIERVKNFYKKNDPKNTVLRVSYSALDDDTRKALGIPAKVKKDDYKNKYVVYNPDGSFKLDADAKGRGGTPGTLEQIRKGFIDVVKSGLDEKGTQSEGFQLNAENGFYKIFGVNNAQTIWDGWDSKDAAPASSGKGGTYNIKGKEYTEEQLIGMGYTVDQIKPYKK